MIGSILTIVREPPYGCEDAFAGLRFALSQIASGALARSDVLLLGDGVYNAVIGQRSHHIDMPSNLEATEDILALEGAVYCVTEDMDEREVTPDRLADGVDLIANMDVAALVARYDSVTTF